MDENATITVKWRGHERTFELDGTEFSDSGEHRYFTTASADFISSEVEMALAHFIKVEEQGL